MFIEKTCDELAELIGGELVGDCDNTLSGVSTLKEAMSTDVAFFAVEKYRPLVMPSRAGVVLVPRDFEEEPPDGRAWIKCDDPSGQFTKIVALFTPPPEEYPAGIAPSAVIDPSAEIGEGVHIGANVVIGANVKIGAESILMPGVVIQPGVVIGAKCMLYPNVVIRERCILGKRVILQPGVVIGADGFGYEPSPMGHKKIPQVGIVQIDDDVEVGANTTIDRARFGRTWIQQGTKIDNLVQVAHNVQVGPLCFLVAQCGIAGSTEIGAGVILAGQAGVSGHIQIGDGVTVGPQAGITKNVAAGTTLLGSPAKPHREFAKREMYINKIEGLLKEVQALKEELKKLKD